jgi:NTE family protein
VIGTRNDARLERRQIPRCPSFGQIFGYMLDALFSDGLYSDLERINQINEVLRQVGPVRTAHSVLKPVELMVFLPSRDLSTIARERVLCLPRSLRVLLRTMGAMNPGGGELMSYLMFQSEYTRELIALGYRDAMDRSGELIGFLGGEFIASTGATQAMQALKSTS